MSPAFKVAVTGETRTTKVALSLLLSPLVNLTAPGIPSPKVQSAIDLAESNSMSAAPSVTFSPLMIAPLAEAYRET